MKDLSASSKAKMNSSYQKPLTFLRQVFLDRKEKNSSYSMRAFARDLGMSQSLLSLIFSGKRPLTIKQAIQISVLLGMPQSTSQAFIESVMMSLPENSKGLKKFRALKESSVRPLFTNYDIERFKMISLWYHVAILDLCTTANFRHDFNWIAARLNISAVEARDAVERLLALGFLEKKNGTLKKITSKAYFVTQKSEPAVRAFHKQMMTLAQQKLDEVDEPHFAQREISAITMAARKDRIPEAKKRIQKFQTELAEFLTEGDCDEVFQMNIQLFPLTKKVIVGVKK